VSEHKWQIGPVKLADGTDAWIFFVQPESKHQRYIGKAKDSDGEWRALHWCDSGRVGYTATEHAKNLAPPPKKTVRVRASILVYSDGSTTCKREHELFSHKAKSSAFAIVEIDREVTEGEGL